MSTYVLGRNRSTGPSAVLGRYRAQDGSDGAHVALDIDAPHAALVVGKRGTGKSYTLGVLAEELLDAPGVTPLVVDPMGAFGGLEAAGAMVREPTVPASALPPRAWPDAVDLDPETAPGALVWRATETNDTLAEMREFVAGADGGRVAANHPRRPARLAAPARDRGRDRRRRRHRVGPPDFGARAPDGTRRGEPAGDGAGRDRRI